MHVLLIGGKGMLGNDLLDAVIRRGGVATVLDLPEVDILQGRELADRLPPADIAINCAAFTRVDDAERERELCWNINAVGAHNVARACAQRRIPLLHLSTDYVFDGRKGSPYSESDPVAPLNYYGQSKREGELRVLEAGGPAVIVRTQSLYGVRGRNFVRAILGQLQQNKTPLRVVSDQISSPTYTRHLAEALLDLAARRPPNGIVHAAASGACSWWDFAKAIVLRVRPGVDVEPRATSELNYPAPRPPYSVLGTAHLAELIGRHLPTWEEGLDAYLAEEPLTAELRRR
ncbi:MAG: dTDP-4-dehydrorhamnose reductase [Kiritimatiellae bacterium]|nr:dTDP-4-dehydrorhamnose reductase [Kiritimatiellia bacterium]